MPWNEPGANGDGPRNDSRDPWGAGGGRRPRRDAPPDLDEIMRDIKRRIDAMLGIGGGGRASGGGGKGAQGSGRMLFLALLVVLGFYLFTGVYTVDESEQAVELRFGAYKSTEDAGLHYHWPMPFESVEIVNTKKVNTVEVGYRKIGQNEQSVAKEALMLTQDENIIDIKFAVQYDIRSPTNLLFQVSEYDPRNIAESVVRQATESAVREIVGRNTMDFAITGGRAQLAAETKILVQRILDRYNTGINIRAVEMQNAQPPAQVKDAFDDAVKAREDEQRLKNLAEAYARDIIPRARGAAARITQEAEAYRASVVADAEGASARFIQVLDEYAKAPSVTRDRLYLEAMEEVLSRSSKLVIDQQGGNSLMYLPLDQLIKQRATAPDSRSQPSAPSSQATNRVQGGNLRSSSRQVDRNSGRN